MMILGSKSTKIIISYAYDTRVIYASCTHTHPELDRRIAEYSNKNIHIVRTNNHAQIKSI